MTVVYLDRVVLLNLAVDYLLLLATARLAGLPLRRGRLGLCAALGAAYAAAVTRLYQAGIVSGDDKGNYRPDDEILRSEACVIFTRIAVPEERAK